MKVLYETRVQAIGGRHGRVKSDDGLLDLALSPPVPLGGKGDATNPEQLFAAGYAACFENAILHVARGQGAKVKDEDVEVNAEVGIGPNESGGFVLSVSLDVVISGVDQALAQKVADAAHAACPYSNAVRGNIDVGLTVTARD